jgi:hypothetical protein
MNDLKSEVSAQRSASAGLVVIAACLLTKKIKPFQDGELFKKAFRIAGDRLLEEYPSGREAMSAGETQFLVTW